MTIDDFNERWQTPGIRFEEGPEGFVFVRLHSIDAEATLTLHGAHLLSYRTDGEQPILWTSASAIFQDEKAIRGGIPICWPWFANHPSDDTKPAHGFARTSKWHVLSTEHRADAEVLRLGLEATEETRALWSHNFQLIYEITLAETLMAKLTVHNPGKDAFQFTGALHSYFEASHISRVAVRGLDHVTYIDSIDDCRQKEQEGDITFTEEVDRIYLDTTDTCLIYDRAWDRTVSVAKEGSRSTVVWNPWIDKAKRMADFGDNEYNEMVCVETANAATDEIEVGPGESHSLSVELSLLD